jgi:prefoldin subunit 5
MNNFIGKDGFNWWYGVVEDVNDPAKLGRAKVRIFGHHTDNLVELPTKDLPWAAAVNPVNNSKSFSAPRLGDYVMGFFSDGASSQAPIMMGVFPGLEATPNKNKGFSPQSNLKPATPPNGQVQYEAGKPTLAPLARGEVDKTAISQSNANLAHVCDISANMKFEIAKMAFKVSELVETIRASIKGLWASASSSPFADEVRSAVKTIKAQIKVIQKFIKKVQDNIKAVTDLVDQLQKLIQYIATLPARIAKFLQDCLREAIGGISGAIAVGQEIQKNISEGNVSLANLSAVAAEESLTDKETIVPTQNTIVKP